MARKLGRPAGWKPNGPEIRRLRTLVHGLSAAELGAKAGLTEYLVWKAERSLPVMDVNVARLARALGVEVEDIASPPIAALDAKNRPRRGNDGANERDYNRSQNTKHTKGLQPVTGYTPAEQDIRAARGLPYATGADQPPGWHDQPGTQPETRAAS